jgi:hypothetical protein
LHLSPLSSLLSPLSLSFSPLSSHSLSSICWSSELDLAANECWRSFVFIDSLCIHIPHPPAYNTMLCMLDTSLSTVRLKSAVGKGEGRIGLILAQLKVEFGCEVKCTMAWYIQSSFVMRDSLRREKANKREVLWCVWLMSQANCDNGQRDYPVSGSSCHRQIVTTLNGIILLAGALQMLFPSRLTKFRLYEK